jgi:hypothetical protein
MLDTRDRANQNAQARLPPNKVVEQQRTSYARGTAPLVHKGGSSGPSSIPSEDTDYEAFEQAGGEKKDRVKQVGRGRKRRLASTPTSTPIDDEVPEEDADYHPPPSHDNPKPAKRHHTTTSASSMQRPDHVEDEKQSAGCTDEWQQPSASSDDAEEEQEEEEENNNNKEEQEEGHSDGVPHPAPRTWVAKVEWALGRLGGKGTLADIYSTIEDAFPEEVDGKRNWKAAIRSCLSKNEKNKFFKPASSALVSKDHVWCLASPRPRAATAKRGRPSGRGRRASTTSAPRNGRKQESTSSTMAVEPSIRLACEDEDVDNLRRTALLQQKQQLELDINRLLQEDCNEGGESGLSADQEDFLSRLLRADL